MELYYLLKIQKQPSLVSCEASHEYNLNIYFINWNKKPIFGGLFCYTAKLKEIPSHASTLTQKCLKMLKNRLFVHHYVNKSHIVACSLFS